MRLKIENYNTIKSVEMEVGNNTFVYGKDEQMKFDLVNAIIGFMSKTRWTTTDKESGINPKVYLNDKILDLSVYELVYIPGVLNINNELKLATGSILKSIILKILIEALPISDEINTLQLLLSDFIDDTLNVESKPSYSLSSSLLNEKDIFSFLVPALKREEKDLSLKKLKYFEIVNIIYDYVELYSSLINKKILLLCPDFGYGLNKSQIEELHERIMFNKNGISVFLPVKDVKTVELKNINIFENGNCCFINDFHTFYEHIRNIYPKFTDKDDIKLELSEFLQTFSFKKMLEEPIIYIWKEFEQLFFFYELLKLIKVYRKFKIVYNHDCIQDPFYCYLKDMIGCVHI